MRYCDDCGCIMDRGHCTNCHEEVFIAEQHYELGTWEDCGEWFRDKVNEQLNNPK